MASMTSLKQADQVVTMQAWRSPTSGFRDAAQPDQQHPWFSKPELVEIVAANVLVAWRSASRPSSTCVFAWCAPVEAQKATLHRNEVVGGKNMAKKTAPKYDFEAATGDLQRQFQNLDPKDPSLWPALPRTLCCAC